MMAEMMRLMCRVEGKKWKRKACRLPREDDEVSRQVGKWKVWELGVVWEQVGIGEGEVRVRKVEAGQLYIAAL